MNRIGMGLASAAGAAVALAGVALVPRILDAEPPAPHHQASAPAKPGGVVVMLCDGKTSVEIDGLKPGQRMSHEQALAVTRALMDKWRREHLGERWQTGANTSGGGSSEYGDAAKMGAAQPQASGVPTGKAPSTQQGDTYASFHERDFKVWQAETQKFVDEGKRIFHDSKELGSTIGVSCDMCHPDAANTHPETYPKYQVQLQRVALLRDMIDWCIENPIKGKTLDPNDPKLRALEAYILAQRKGVALDYGKH
jgi:SoxA/TsdA, cytochrome c domain